MTRAVINKQLHNLGIAPTAGIMQRGAAFVVRPGGVRTVLGREEQPRHLEVTIACGPVERGVA